MEILTRSLEARAERLGKMEREVRNVHRPVELRQADDGAPVVFGYAATFVPYEVEDLFGTYTEEVVPGAFSKTLAERADVRLLLNHEGLPLARTKSQTLTLAQDDIGLRYESRLEPSDPDVQRLVPKMERGDLTDSSFAFRAVRQEWNEDYTYRRLLEVKLFDVSIVTYPANPTASAQLRGADLIARLADFDPEELLTEVRDARSPVGPEELERAAKLLAQLCDPRSFGSDAEPSERDMPSTMSLEQARRNLEVLALRVR